MERISRNSAILLLGINYDGSLPEGRFIGFFATWGWGCAR